MKTILALLLIGVGSLFPQTWTCEKLPSERITEVDPETGIEVLFATTNPANDYNLYFHDRCWLLDNSLMLFTSDRSGRAEIYGYYAPDGSIFRLDRADETPAVSPVASRLGDRLYVIREEAIYEWKVSLKPSDQLDISERLLCRFPENSERLAGLNENSDASLVSFAYKKNEKSFIAVVNTGTGEQQVAAVVDFPIQHVQFHWNRPDLISFARSYGSDTAPLDPDEPAHARIWFVNVNTKTPVPAFFQQPGQLVTHECWWVNDQITFISGFRPEEAHVMALDIKTGDIRIIGAGAWWEGADNKTISQYNWWHASGSPDGRWIAADNWHGIITLFDARTTEKRILTAGHRIYGGGAHPHVGWDLRGDSVEFASNKRGNPDVCIVKIPQEWR